MGIIKSSFSFMLGAVCGVYIAQNYNVPNIHKLADYAVLMAKQMEESRDSTLHPRSVEFYIWKISRLLICLALELVVRKKKK
ncbi:hypothetical protein Ccrd_014059 [Cynara cardunculus var. scolymus]|uniref:Uncharacterized protein n=1 Tax=Cynara cardunculus var. scolymus TaxID=59895 RepID=A0A103YEG7_CYNCS|nr:hypothetical protein Ccrd_014059 [Cynara cardunculus var. scolymus]